MGVVAAFDRLLRGRAPTPARSQHLPLTFQEYVDYFTFNGQVHPLLGLNQTYGPRPQEQIGQRFGGLVEGAYKQDGVVFAVMLARLLLFSEARFQFRQLRSGRPGDLFGNADLRPLEQPWPGGTTGDLLVRAICHADLAGNFFCIRRGPGVRVLRPDWVTVILGGERVSNDPLDYELAGYGYTPGGPASGNEPVIFMPEEVCHFAPIPDPIAQYRGMSWLEPVIREIMADKATTDHKLRFFDQGATPNMVVQLEVPIENFDAWVEKFQARNEGAANAYKTLFLGQGASATVVGNSLREMDFKQTQGAGETRIAAAGGVPPVIVGLSEGLQAATYSNYGQARRRYADLTMRPLWRNFAGSIAKLVRVPSDAELWYDDRDIPFLQEDVKEAAEVLAQQASAIKTLVDGGFEADSAVQAIVSGDLRRLKHTGLNSVQLQPPATANGNGGAPAAGAEEGEGGNGAGNGNGATPAAAAAAAKRMLEEVSR